MIPDTSKPNHFQFIKLLNGKIFDRLVLLAQNIAGSPIAGFGLLVKEKFYLISENGLSVDSYSKDGSFCKFTLENEDFFEVSVAEDNKSFDDNEFIKNHGVRYYAAYPVTESTNKLFGTLFIMDQKAQILNSTQRESLKLLAEEAGELLQEKLELISLKRTERQYKNFFVKSQGLLCTHDLEGKLNKVNESSAASLGYKPADLEGKTLFDIIPKKHHDGVWEYLNEIKETGVSNGLMKTIHKNGSHRIWLYNNALERHSNGEAYILGNALDITRRHYLELEHKKLKEILEETNSVAKIGSWEYEPLKDKVTWSPITKKIHGVSEDYTPSVTEGINFFKEGRSRDMIMQALKDTYERGIPYDLEIQLNTAHGKELWVRAIGKPEFVNGKCVRLFGTFQDIDERKQAELEIKKSRRLLKNVLNAAITVGIIATDPKGNITVFNKGAEILLGYKSEEMVGKHTPEILHEKEEWLKRGKALSKKYHTPIEGFRVLVHESEFQESDQREWTYIRKDGSRFPVSLVMTTMWDPAGEKLGYLGLAVDISEQKKAKKDLELERARLKAFVTHAPAAVAMFDKDIKYIAYSNRWLEEYKLEGKNLVGRTHYEVFPNVSEHWKEIHQRCLNGEVISQEEDNWRPEGWDHDQYLRWEVRPWEKHDGSIGGILMLTQDVTEASIRKEELRKAKVQAELASRAKSEFLANMSHEIRTPLNGIIGFTDLILKTQMTKIQHQYLSIINQSANALLQIINDILDFSKIEAGKLELDIEQSDIFELNSESTDIISYQIHKKGLELLLHLHPDLPRYIWVDKVRIKQVLVNLLSNAAKFTEKGEIQLEVVPLTSLNRDNEITIRFSVKDTGIGIKKDKQQKIFEAFAQEDISTTKRYGGTGLGLAISNSLLKMMGSHLQLESEVGMGSTFYFDLKVKAKMKSTDSASPVKVNHALIVDDNENNRLILKEMLTAKGISFEEATNELEALEKIQNNPEFDLILMDYNMPFMDGLETIRKIRENFDQNKNSQSIILLLHSSTDETDIHDTCKELDVVPMTKPIKVAALDNFFQGQAERNLVEETPISTNPSISPGLKILIVEDNMINMLLAKTVINKISPEAIIDEAHNGAEALEKSKTFQPDIIFMDIQLPEMNGYEVTRKIREEFTKEKILIIALTAGNVKGEKEKCLEAGMDDFIAKPFVEKDLLHLMEKWSIESKNSTQNLGLEVDNSSSSFDLKWFRDFLGEDLADEVIIQSLLNTSLKELVKSKKLLIKAQGESDLKLLKAMGHKLYGSSCSLGLHRLSELSAELETFPTENADSPEIKDLVQNILQLMDRNIREIETHTVQE